MTTSVTPATPSTPYGDRSDPLRLGSLTVHNRLLVGTGGMTSLDAMKSALQVCGAEVATVAMRRYGKGGPDVYGMLVDLGVNVLPNTAGCKTAREAILTARMAREALHVNRIKLEIIADDHTLLPDTTELVGACEELVADDFEVLAYTNDDPVVARRLISAGAVAVMPGGAPIGTGLGILNPHNISLIVSEAGRHDIPVIIDAGIGTASEAALAMELGCAGVLTASAITRCRHPEKMARAMASATMAGRLAYVAGRIPTRQHATASSPTEGLAWSKEVL